MGYLNTMGEMGVIVITCNDLLINNIYWPIFFFRYSNRGSSIDALQTPTCYVKIFKPI